MIFLHRAYVYGCLIEYEFAAAFRDPNRPDGHAEWFSPCESHHVKRYYYTPQEALRKELEYGRRFEHDSIIKAYFDAKPCGPAAFPLDGRWYLCTEVSESGHDVPESVTAHVAGPYRNQFEAEKACVESARDDLRTYVEQLIAQKVINRKHVTLIEATS